MCVKMACTLQVLVMGAAVAARRASENAAPRPWRPGGGGEESAIEADAMASSHVPLSELLPVSSVATLSDRGSRGAALVTHLSRRPFGKRRL